MRIAPKPLPTSRAAPPLRAPIPSAPPPRTAPAAAEVTLASLSSQLAPLAGIAASSLAANIHDLDEGPFLSAGKNQFKSLWTRDFCWSVKGLLASGRSDVVKNQLDTLLGQLQPGTHLLPRTLDTMDPKKRVLLASLSRVLPFIKPEQPLEGPLHPEYQDQNGQIAIDGNALAILATLDYVDATGDRAFLAAHQAELVEALRFYDAHMQGGLVTQPPFSDWQDSVKREGATFYTNVLYQRVLERLQGNPAFGITADQVQAHRQATDAAFFDASTGMYRSVAGRPQVSLDGNLLAIDLGYLAPDSARAGAVYAAVKASPFWSRTGTPGFDTYPDYAATDRSLSVNLSGLGHYHDELQWSWLMALSGKVAIEMGDLEGAHKSLGKLQQLAQRDGGIAEIYTAGAEAKPVSTLLYRSEQPFSWGAAYAVDALATLARRAGA